MKTPIAQGIVVGLGARHRPEADALSKESLSILRALDAEGRIATRIDGAPDLILLIVDADTTLDELELPDLKDRAASVIGIGDDAPSCRVAITNARKRLRGQGAALGARALVFAPAQFGFLGLESDGSREKLEILLRALVLDAERLRLRREGWEEPDEVV